MLLLTFVSRIDYRTNPDRHQSWSDMPYSHYLPEHMGSIALSPPGPFVAGSYAELTLVYTAGTLTTPGW
jgi:hypothetical protein